MQPWGSLYNSQAASPKSLLSVRIVCCVCNLRGGPQGSLIFLNFLSLVSLLPVSKRICFELEKIAIQEGRWDSSRGRSQLVEDRRLEGSFDTQVGARADGMNGAQGLEWSQSGAHEGLHQALYLRNEKIMEVLTGVTDTPDVLTALRSQPQPPGNLLLGGQWPSGRFQLTSLHTQRPFCKSLQAIAYFLRADVEMELFLLATGLWGSITCLFLVLLGFQGTLWVAQSLLSLRAHGTEQHLPPLFVLS